MRVETKELKDWMFPEGCIFIDFQLGWIIGYIRGALVSHQFLPFIVKYVSRNILEHSAGWVIL
jgi:hypothetical protein